MILPDTQRTGYAGDFLEYFRPEFNQLDDVQNSFSISRLEFAKFMWDKDLLPDDWEKIPTPEDKECWAYMRNAMNKVRSEMNKSASLGLHGEPPFEAVVLRKDMHSGTITVRNLSGMAMVTYQEVGGAIEKYLNNKFSAYRKKHQFLSENSDRLPHEVQGKIGACDLLLGHVIRQATNGLSDYMKSVDTMVDQIEDNTYPLLEE